MTTVTIDGACLLPPRAGIARYLDGLLGGLRSLDTGDVEVEIVRPESRRATVRWVLWDLQWASSGFELLHCPFYYPPPVSRCPVVCAVHDVLVLEHPEWFPRPWADVMAGLIRLGARRSDVVVTASEHVAERIEVLCRIPRSRIEVMAYGVDRSIFSPPPPEEIGPVLAKFGIAGPYVVQMGSFERRRGLDLTMEALGEIRRERPDMTLVLIGEVRDRVEALADPLPWVRQLGRVDDAFLPALFAGAATVVSPSRDEGFDFPLLEALACGGAVVASDIEVHREHFEPAVVLFESGRSDALAEGIRKVLDSGRSDALSRGAAEHAKAFSWSLVAERHLNLWRRIVG
ncbi:MAG: glycosyltransferase family 1 protein [Acidobacteriota bacterium]